MTHSGDGWPIGGTDGGMLGGPHFARGARTMRRRNQFLVAGLLLVAGGCALADDPALPYTPGLDVSAMDRTVDPCADFYLYSCGGWKKNHPIPPDQTSWSVYRKLSEDNLAFLRRLLEQAAAAQDADAVTRQIGDYLSLIHI